MGKLNEQEITRLENSIKERRNIQKLYNQVKRNIVELKKISREKKSSLFFKILNSLHNEGVLEDIILIGSWSHYFYKDYFSYAPEIPLLRTLDIDFLIPNPPRIQKKVNIPEILENFDFIPLHSRITGSRP